jgi:xanthine/CO dehydrogenase XdhC/CoxF family maturation factor
VTELERIAAALGEAASDGSRALLATVVACEGSTYRRVGARMAVTPAGIVGAISGGCLETDVLERRARLEASGRAELVSYDGRSPEELVWGLGLGCNGRIEVLLEPLAGATLQAASRCLARAVALRRAALATVVATGDPARIALGERLLLDADGVRAGGTLSLEEAETLQRDGVRFELLWEPVAPSPRLSVCGAGTDAIPVVQLAAQIGWRVELLDHRAAFASAGRFPAADAITVAAAGAAAKALEASAPDAVVVMSHQFERDLEYLAAALTSPVAYVGILGPKARAERLLAALAERGFAVDAALRARLFAPVGLDLGAETPEEIALAIVSELLAAWRGRNGASLRERSGAIHSRAQERE